MTGEPPQRNAGELVNNYFRRCISPGGFSTIKYIGTHFTGEREFAEIGGYEHPDLRFYLANGIKLENLRLREKQELTTGWGDVNYDYFEAIEINEKKDGGEVNKFKLLYRPNPTGFTEVYLKGELESIGGHLSQYAKNRDEKGVATFKKGEPWPLMWITNCPEQISGYYDGYLRFCDGKGIDKIIKDVVTFTNVHGSHGLCYHPPENLNWIRSLDERELREKFGG